MELQILNLIQDLRTPVGDRFMTFVTGLGNAGMIWIMLAVVLALIPGMRKCGAVLAAALCIDAVLCNGILKNLFARIRPCDVDMSVQLLIPRPADFSFPSGHTAASFAAATALFLTGERRPCKKAPLLPEGRRSGKLWVLALILACLIAWSRLYLYVHYPTDILGGIVVGVTSGYAGYRAVTAQSFRKGRGDDESARTVGTDVFRKR